MVVYIYIYVNLYFSLLVLIMQILALVRDVQVSRQNPEKPFAIITLETEMPLQIVEVRLFKNQLDSGIAEKLIPLKGKLVHFPVECGIYNNRLQYQYPFGGEVIPVQSAKAAA